MTGKRVRVGFTASRQTVLDTIYKMGVRCCAYSGGDTWADRCDCKYGVAEGK